MKSTQEKREMSDGTILCVCVCVCVCVRLLLYTHTRLRCWKKKRKNSLVQHWIAPGLQRRRLRGGRDREERERDRKKTERGETERLAEISSQAGFIEADGGSEIRWYIAMELLSINPSNIPRDTHHITTEPSVPSHTQTDRPPSDTLPPLPKHPHSVRERERKGKREGKAWNVTQS